MNSLHWISQQTKLRLVRRATTSPSASATVAMDAGLPTKRSTCPPTNVRLLIKTSTQRYPHAPSSWETWCGFAAQECCRSVLHTTFFPFTYIREPHSHSRTCVGFDGQYIFFFHGACDEREKQKNTVLIFNKCTHGNFQYF